jgi:uncharacterized protein YciW
MENLLGEESFKADGKDSLDVSCVNPEDSAVQESGRSKALIQFARLLAQRAAKIDHTNRRMES